MTTDNMQDQIETLAGLRILVVEDEMMLAMMIEDILTGLGCDVVKAARVAQALDLVATNTLDGAVLDINVAGEVVYPVAQALQKRGVPFIFSSGYGDSGVPPEYAARPMLSKPFPLTELGSMLRRVIQSRNH